ncbi:hypothetical protein [Rhizobium vallis]|uniref:hypothetical protein n=1 Tax=Rhizobium vallis TaxID=634290 RepID=UPI000F891D47|nr:hypothetical protein [Rhizobium vallis]
MPPVSMHKGRDHDREGFTMDFHPRAAGASNRPFVCANTAGMSRMAQVAVNEQIWGKSARNRCDSPAGPAEGFNLNDALQQLSALLRYYPVIQ